MAITAGSPTVVQRYRFLGVGAFLGLTWAAGLRAWMVQLAGKESSFTWLTFLLVLLPGALVGGLLGRAAHDRSEGAPSSRWLVFAPVLLASALLDPTIFVGLIRHGTGGGALMVVFTVLAAAYVLTRRRWSLARAGAAVVAVPGLLLLGLMGGMAAPLSTARGAWVCLFGFSYVVVLCLGSTLPYVTAPRLTAGRLVALGALCGFAWAAGLRGFMSIVAGAESQVEWGNTFGFILLPGAVIGALLGWAESERRRGVRRAGVAWSPLLFASVLVSGLLHPSTMFQGGIGGGAIGVPVVGIIGGYALAGGRRWLRAGCGLLFLAGLVVWALTAEAVGGTTFALTTPHGAWATVDYYALLVSLALGVSVPLRWPRSVASGPPPPDREGVTPPETAPVAKFGPPSRTG